MSEPVVEVNLVPIELFILLFTIVATLVITEVKLKITTRKKR